MDAKHILFKHVFHSFCLWFFLGLQHQGIFRVSGSQVEVNDIKNSFERGVCKCGNRVQVSEIAPKVLSLLNNNESLMPSMSYLSYL